MKTCFVIQRFDGGVYDKRYRETFAPAIERGGAKPLRADEVLGTRPVVEKIEAGLKSADIAFAEVSEDNPNVFLELGFALALSIPTVIVCDRSKRLKLPFDIAHRTITFYTTDAQSDYENIARNIEKEVGAALLERPIAPPEISSGLGSRIDIDDVKGACLIALLDRSLRSPQGATLWEIQKEVSTAGINERMTALAIASLTNEELILQAAYTDDQGDPYLAYTLSDTGTKHLLRSYSSLMQLERDRTKPAIPKKVPRGFADDLDDDVPF